MTPYILRDELEKWIAKQLELWKLHGANNCLSAIVGLEELERAIQSGAFSPAVASDGLLPCKLCGRTPNTEPLHGKSGPETVVCSNEWCLLGNMAINPEVWNKAMSTPIQDGWQPIETAPLDGTPFLVLLETELMHSKVHAASFLPNIKTIGCLFSFDAPKAIAWKPIGPLPAQPLKEKV